MAAETPGNIPVLVEPSSLTPRNPFRWTLAGEGSAKVDDDGRVMCGTPSLRGYTDPDKNGVVHLSKRPMTCGRATCPHDFPHWERVTTFNIAVQIEVMARVLDCRPAVLVYSPESQEASTWTDPEIAKYHQRKSLRRLKAMGVTGGVAVQHRYRIKNGIPDQIRATGWKNGLWEAVHENVLDLPSWLNYVKPGIHAHAIVFPGYLKPHTKINPIVAKYDVLEGLGNVVGHVRYLLDHTAFQEGESDRSYTAFGDMYGWDIDGVVDAALLLVVREAVATRVGMVWNDHTKKLEYKPDELLLGVEPEPEFKGIGMLHQDMISPGWTANLSDSQYEFLQRVLLSMKGYNHDSGGGLTSWLPSDVWEPLVPSDMKVWGDEIPVPPWSEAEGSSDPDNQHVPLAGGPRGAGGEEPPVVLPSFIDDMKIVRRSDL